jgi:hypothetical protein
MKNMNDSKRAAGQKDENVKPIQSPKVGQENRADRPSGQRSGQQTNQPQRDQKSSNVSQAGRSNQDMTAKK